MIDTKQIQLFISVFRSRTDVYARHWEKNGKSGYSPAYEFNWGEFMAHKARGGNLSNFPNKKTLLLTLEVIKSHLEGIQSIGIYPLLEDNTSYFIAADFDKENWQTESTNFIKICRQFGMTLPDIKDVNSPKVRGWFAKEVKRARELLAEDHRLFPQGRFSTLGRIFVDLYIRRPAVKYFNNPLAFWNNNYYGASAAGLR